MYRVRVKKYAKFVFFCYKTFDIFFTNNYNNNKHCDLFNKVTHNLRHTEHNLRTQFPRIAYTTRDRTREIPIS